MIVEFKFASDSDNYRTAAPTIAILIRENDKKEFWPRN